MKTRFILRLRAALAAGAVVCAIVFAACKSEPPAPPPEPEPSASIAFAGIGADDPSRVSLDFTLSLVNPRQAAAGVRVAGKKVTVNGVGVSPVGETSGIVVSGTPDETPLWLDASGALESPFTVELDIPALLSAGVPLLEEMSVTVELDIAFMYAAGGQSGTVEEVRVKTAEETAFPLVREPVFSITAIAVLKAELVNTRFRVTMKIDNPNPFPMELSSFGYELYGNGLLWADGTEKNVFLLPPKTSTRADLYLLMNFINMKRDLLDQVIRLEDVNYRFTGSAVVGTGVDYLLEFTSAFDLSGYSPVLDK